MEKIVRMIDFTYNRDKVSYGTRELFSYGLVAKLMMERAEKPSKIADFSLAISPEKQKEFTEFKKALEKELNKLELVLYANQDIMANILDIIYYSFKDYPDLYQTGYYTPTKTREQIMEVANDSEEIDKIHQMMIKESYNK